MSVGESGPLQGRVIFLVGMMRSGTNWLQRMLVAHQDIDGVPQETDLLLYVQELRDHFQHANSASLEVGRPYLSAADFIARMRQLCDDVLGGYLSAGSTRHFLLERTPQHVDHLDLVADIYPDAHVVHIIRDGRDVARSLVNMDFGPATIPEAAEQWRSSILKARRDASRLEHYQEVRYEELLADPASTISGLWEGIGVDYSTADVDRALEAAGVRFNVDRNSPEVGAGKWRAEFGPEDVAAFDRLAGDLLAELGYAASGSVGASSADPGRARSRPAAARKPWRRLRLPGRSAAGPRDALKVQLGQTSGLVNSLLEALMSDSIDRLETVFTSDCRIRLVSAGADWAGRGAEARARLLAHLQVDRALHGKQLRVDVHPGLSQWVILGAYGLDGGGVEQRLMILQMAGGAVAGLDFYQLPLTLV